jgi:hypothetical protein
MKSLRFFSIILLISAASSFSLAQELYFCEGVDEDGYPVNESSVFTISDEGGYLYALVRLPYEVDCSSVSLIVYKVNSRGKETYDNTINIDVKRNWVWFWKQITFYNDGTYKFYVYDCDDYLLASGEVEIEYD